jgi:uncharacterized membrane protein YjgN (DUF898 family)
MLASGILNSATLVWSEGMTDWAPLETVKSSLHEWGGGDAGDGAVPAGAVAYTEPVREHPFEFHGRALEFFRIWIVNVVLTVLTLGIYAAWAKVRTRRYFYGNTLLDGKPFDFTGNPLSILKGNLVFGGLFMIYVVSGSLFPPLALAVILLIMLIAPWMIQKALRFRAHHTVHRNVRLNFRGTVGESYTVFMWLAILVPFTAGLIMPYIQFRQRKFFFGNLGWGSCQAHMNGGAGFFYKTFFKCFGLIILVGLLASIAIPVISMADKKAQESKAAGKSASAVVLPQAGVHMGQSPGQVDLEGEVNKAIEQQIALNPGMSEEDKEKLRNMKGQIQEMTRMIVFFVVPLYLLMFAAIIYYQVRTNNYCINSTQWGTLGHLESRVRVRDLMWLYFSNGVAVLLSLGLLIPWVMVRMARYRASKTVLIAGGSLDSVAASAGSMDSALGDAGADIFDFDIGF